MKFNEWMPNALKMALFISVFMAASILADDLEGDEGFQAIEAKIRLMAPNAPTIAISETPIDGVLQVQLSNEIYYATSDAKYLIAGRIIDMDTQVNLTDQAKAGIRKDLLTNLDASQQISFTPTSPVHELMVFTDIDCGYCRKLHSQIEGYMAAGIAINYMAFPRAGVGSHSYDKFVSVWCADDQRAALTDAKAGNEPEPKQCENPITEQYDLGRALGVSGTPALVTPDGTLIPGYMPPEQLKERLEALDAQVAQAP
jgi:thiol:disulfide interchange protein DsbC